MTYSEKFSQDAHVPTSTGGIMRTGTLLVALLAVGLGGWSATAELASAIIAPGRVTVDSQSKTISHVSGGVVREIFVADGDKVTAGQTILKLDDTQARASVAILEQRYHQAQAVEARLLAEQQQTDAITFPPEILARRHETDMRLILQNQRHLFSAGREARAAEAGLFLRRAAHSESEIANLKVSLAANGREIALANEEYGLQKKLFEKKLITRSRLIALQRLATSLEGRRGALGAQIDRAERAYNDAKLNIELSKREFLKNVEQELRDVRAEKFDLREQLTAARFVLQESIIVAPEDGIVVNKQVRVAGDVVRPGGALLELVPTGDTLLVEVSVDPIDIDNLVVGQSADIRFTAFAQRTTPLLHGTVTYVAADTVEEPRTGLPYYTARIAVSDAEVKRLNDGRLQPGMPADVAIKTGEKTVLDYLLQPLRDSLFKAWREA